IDFNLTANYNGFNTTMYNRQAVGAAPVRAWLFSRCSTFGLSCNYKSKLTRILPPARKISDLLIHFVGEVLPFKPKWQNAYVYRKSVEDTTEDCFWYINALEAASANFARNVTRQMLRTEDSLRDVLTTTQRHSNIFILCGSPNDVVSVKSKLTSPIIEETLFILLDVYK
ncbi:unnamed protein product, partial [Tetraodon nigroviridis]